MTYTIKLQQFEGPFDLLLFFIQRDELDIHDIPIAKITDDFLNYIYKMEALNIEMASEFILVAAKLMRIKAKMLIPRKPVDEEGNEIDPREELVQRLLEYKRFKEVINDLRELESTRSKKFERGNAASELKKIANEALADTELESLNLYKLMNTFRSVLQKYEEEQQRNVHTIYRYPYTIPEQRDIIFKSVLTGQREDFDDLFNHCENRMHAIVRFLALLELINEQEVHIRQGLGKNNFWIALKTQEEE